MTFEIAHDSVIDGRYRILDRVGSGGMADVYRAEDIHLGRPVALKLLYRRFAQDKEFVERFRREASAAAGLQHPNVVSVYDRGEFDGTYYIAMEFCEGLSLKDVIAREAPLNPKRAIDLARKILVAARFAHRRGVIHRDLKPQNVIISHDETGETVKVADFGIARAGASEITEVGAIMGTAQYLSPEQAQGHSVEQSSDLYSIGVVLFEMLTGRAPFEGDSAVAIALKHVSQPPPSVREFRPEIPAELEAVVMKALAKDPAGRYTDADSFIRDLDSAERALDAGGGADPESTAMFEPVPAPVADVATVPPPATPAETSAAPPLVQAPAPPHPPRRRRALPWLLALLALVAGGVVAYLLLKPERVQVPSVIFQTLPTARDKLVAAGFQVEIDRRADQAPANIVFRQVPTQGEKADKGSTVTLFVSNGPSTVKVPDVLGLSEQDARKRMRDADLKPVIARESSTRVPVGAVIRSDPGPRTVIERKTKVTLLVSTGAEQVTVPDVVGSDQNDAITRLRDAKLGVIVRERASSEAVDTVVDQTPAAGQQVDQGSTVTLFVSNGKLEKVPDVVGLDQAAAESQITDAGFRASVQTKETNQPDRDGRVLSQTPAAGKEKRKGETIAITVGKLATTPAPAPAPNPGGGTG